MSNKESNLKTDMEFRAYGSFGKIKENQMVYDWQDSQFIEYVGFNGGGYFEVMRFSGLIDKNGKKIHEQDIVRLYIQGEYITRKIIFDNNKAMFCLQDKKGNINGWHLNPEKYEVIGNIYENPDLLK